MELLTHADRVAETSTTTGTGALTLSGVAADTGFRTFAAAGITLAYVHYCVTDDAGNWEVGRGLLNGSTLTRNSGHSVVFSSSNANAAVNFGAGDKRVDLVLPATHINKKIHFSTNAPTVNDDRTQGFFDGCLWIVEDPNGSGKTFTQVYYMDAAWAGAAVWKPVGLVVGRGTVSTDQCMTVPDWLPTSSFRWDFTGKNSFNDNAWASQYANHVAAFGDSAKVLNQWSVSLGAGKTTSQTKNGGHQGDWIVQRGYTTDATATDIGYVLATNLVMAEDGADNLFIQVVAHSDDGTDCYAANINALVKIATGAPTIVAQSTTAVGASAGASAWGVVLGVGTDGPKLTVTGQAARNIRWTATVMRACAHKGF